MLVYRRSRCPSFADLKTNNLIALVTPVLTTRWWDRWRSKRPQPHKMILRLSPYPMSIYNYNIYILYIYIYIYYIYIIYYTYYIIYIYYISYHILSNEWDVAPFFEPNLTLKTPHSPQQIEHLAEAVARQRKWKPLDQWVGPKMGVPPNGWFLV